MLCVVFWEIDHRQTEYIKLYQVRRSFVNKIEYYKDNGDGWGVWMVKHRSHRIIIPSKAHSIVILLDLTLHVWETGKGLPKQPTGQV